jgi:hypothetical protein
MMMENSRGGEKLSSNLVMTLFFMCHVSSHKQLVHKIDMFYPCSAKEAVIADWSANYHGLSPMPMKEVSTR